MNSGATSSVSPENNGQQANQQERVGERPQVSRVTDIVPSESDIGFFVDVAKLVESSGKPAADSHGDKDKWLDFTTPDGLYFSASTQQNGTVSLAMTSSLQGRHEVSNPFGLSGKENVKFSYMPNGKIWLDGVEIREVEGMDDATALAKLIEEYEKARSSASRTGKAASLAKRVVTGKVFPKMR